MSSDQGTTADLLQPVVGSDYNDKRRWVLSEIVADARRDVERFEGRPMTGRTVAEYMGCQAAAIAALAKVVETLLPVQS